MKNIRSGEKNKIGGINLAVEILDSLVPQYAQNKSELDSYKKICDLESTKIKQIMEDLVLQQYVVGNYKVTRSVTEKETIDEDILLKIMSEQNVDYRKLGVIKTKDYVDFDAFEKAVYNGDITQEMLVDMDKAKEVKTVVSLRLSKVKKRKEE